MQKQIKENQKVWNQLAGKFKDASALPIWGPFSAGKKLKLIPQIRDKTFLEIGCGSGRSLNYLAKHGAKKVYGLDLSETQLVEAASFNKKAINGGVIELIHNSMETPLKLKNIDIVFSIYAIGWTQNPERTFANIYSYLKKGGLFIWSWDHTFFSDVEHKDGNYVVKHSYHDEFPLALKGWSKGDHTAHITYRKISTWFKLLRDADFEIIEYHEPKPLDSHWGQEDPTRYYAIQKAQKVPCTFLFVCKKN